MYFCGEPKEKQSLQEELERAAGQPDFEVNPVTIVILVRDDVTVLREGLNSIQEQMSGTLYEVVLVCQTSLRQYYEWADELEEVKVICLNEEKESFAK